MIDKKYRNVARITVSDQVHYVFALTRHSHGYVTKHRVWLKLIGLIETADMTR